MSTDKPPELKGGLLEIGARWLAGQSFNNVMQVLLVAAVCYGIYWGLPLILAGYRELNDSHKVQEKALIDAFDRAQERTHADMRSLLRQHGFDAPDRRLTRLPNPVHPEPIP